MRQKIGRYEIKSELGRGGMATVYLAHDPTFQRDVAIKILPREFLHDPTFRARFQREARTVGQLEHPAIVPVYDVGEEDSQPYLVMRYLGGGSLTERLTDEPMPLKEVISIINRIGPALDEAHRQGVIHRDLKPDNLLFDHRGDVFITDFGIAKISQGASTKLTSGGVVIGTPAYLSPEQANGDTLDGRSDIYALGVLLFQMLTGRLPYQADNAIGYILKHITEPVPNILVLNPNLPRRCHQVMVQAMAKSPDDRYATAGTFTNAFIQAVDPTAWPDMDIALGETPEQKSQAAVSEPVQDAVTPPIKKLSTAPLSDKPDMKITCPKCRAVNSRDKRFCRICGTRLKIDCIRCHTENTIESTHCDNCGAPFKQLHASRQKSTQARQQAVVQRTDDVRISQARQLRDTLRILVGDLDNRRKRENALRQLNMLNKKAFDILWEILLNDRDIESRLETAKVLGMICKRSDLKQNIRKQAVEALVDVLNDPEPRMRQQVQADLQEMGEDRSREVSDIFNGILGWLKGNE